MRRHVASEHIRPKRHLRHLPKTQGPQRFKQRPSRSVRKFAHPRRSERHDNPTRGAQQLRSPLHIATHPLKPLGALPHAEPARNALLANHRHHIARHPNRPNGAHPHAAIAIPARGRVRIHWRLLHMILHFKTASRLALTTPRAFGGAEQRPLRASRPIHRAKVNHHSHSTKLLEGNQAK